MKEEIKFLLRTDELLEGQFIIYYTHRKYLHLAQHKPYAYRQNNKSNTGKD